MLHSIMQIIAHGAAVVASAASHSPQATVAAVMCAIMMHLFDQ